MFLFSAFLLCLLLCFSVVSVNLLFLIFPLMIINISLDEFNLMVLHCFILWFIYFVMILGLWRNNPWVCSFHCCRCEILFSPLVKLGCSNIVENFVAVVLWAWLNLNQIVELWFSFEVGFSVQSQQNLVLVYAWLDSHQSYFLVSEVNVLGLNFNQIY